MIALEQIQTMSSREIAELTGKRHDHVLRDCDILNESYRKLSLPKIGESMYVAENRQTYREFLLTRMQTFDLMTGYSQELRIKVNRRWEELETRQLLDFSNPDTVLMLAQNWKEEQVKRIAAEKQLIAQAPKVLFADAVSTSDRSVLIAELAKILKQNGIEIGQNRLFAWLRDKGYLCSKGEYYNQPQQRAMEMGLFELKKTSITKPDGSVLVTVTPKVTGKGQIYFINKFLNAA